MRMTTGSVLGVFCDEYHKARGSGEGHERAFSWAYDETAFLGYPNGSNPDQVMQKIGVSMKMGIIAVYRDGGGRVFSLLSKDPLRYRADSEEVGLELLCISSNPIAQRAL